MKDYVAENEGRLIVNINPKILSFHLWERRFKDELAINLQLPSFLTPLWTSFENYYSEKTMKKKKLILLPLTSTLLLEVPIRGKKIKIKCNLLQGCLLVLTAVK